MHFPLRGTSFLLAASMLLAGATLPIRAAPSPRYPTVTLDGTKTSWRMAVQRIVSIDRFPGIAYNEYSIRRFFALRIRMTNVGTKPADLADDVVLVLRVMPPHLTYYTPGWTLVSQMQSYPTMEKAAAKTYGGVLPFVVTRPSQTMTYSYLIATNRGDSHYGLYQFTLKKGLVLLFPTPF